MKFICALCLNSLFIISGLCNAEGVIRINHPSSGTGKYELSVLKLALSKIDKKYNVELVDEGGATQARVIERVKSGEIDFMWAATNKELEQDLLPIRIPLYKGLLGHRIFLIRNDTQHMFNDINNIEQLKKIKFGQGTTWADTEILKANGLTVITTMKYDGLFYMLDGERFDAFPRGVQEPWDELKRVGKLSITVEKSLMLVYRMPLYFFSSQENSAMARDVEEGLNRAIYDGSFDELFWSSDLVKSVIENGSMHTRKIFYLENPNLPSNTPLDRKELWINVDDIRSKYESKNI